MSEKSTIEAFACRLEANAAAAERAKFSVANLGTLKIEECREIATALVGVCEGCGSSHTLRSLGEKGALSCCPERKMLSAQEWARRAGIGQAYVIGDRTMSAVFKPSGLTNLHDLQAVFDAVEQALERAAAPVVRVKALEWAPSHGGRCLRAQGGGRTYEVRANDAMKSEKQAADEITRLRDEVERQAKQCQIYRDTIQEAWATNEATARRAEAAEARVKELEAALCDMEAYTSGGYDDGRSPPRREPALRAARAALRSRTEGEG